MPHFGCELPPRGAEDAGSLRRYVARLAEELRYTLNNLDDQNISGGGISPGKITGLDNRVGEIAKQTIGQARIGAAQIHDLKAQVAQIVTAVIGTAVIDWAEIQTLTATIAQIAQAEIEDATIQTAQIANLAATIAQIAQAQIGTATIQTAQIDNLSAVIATAIHQEAEVGSFDLAEVSNLLAQALVLESGSAGSMYITNLAVTSANLLSATLGELVLKGADGLYYRVVVGSEGTISTEVVTLTSEEIAQGVTSQGQGIVETTQNVAALNAESIRGKEALLNTILTEALTAGKITAGEALLASATIPALYATSIQAIGNSLDLSANQSILLQVQQVTEDMEAAVAQTEDKITTTNTTLASNIEMLQDQINTTVTQITQAENALTGKADSAQVEELTTQLQQTASDLTVIIGKTTALEGGQAAVQSALEAYQLSFRVDAEGVTIGKSNSDFDMHMDNTQLQFRQNGRVIAYISNNKLYISDAEITNSLQIGHYTWKILQDGSMGLMFDG